MPAFDLCAPRGVPPSRSAPRSFPNGEPQVPRQGWVFPFLAKENPMSNVLVTRVLRPVCTLLGGSGHVRVTALRPLPLAALLQRQHAPSSMNGG